MIRAIYGLVGIVLMLFLQNTVAAVEVDFTEIQDEFNQITGISLTQPQHFSITGDLVELDYSDFTILRIQQQQNYYFIINKVDLPLKLLAKNQTNPVLDGVNLSQSLLIISTDKGQINLLGLPKEILQKIQTYHSHLGDTLEITPGVYVAAQLNAEEGSAIEDLFYSQLSSKQKKPNVFGNFSLSRLGDIINQQQNQSNKEDNISLNLKGSLDILKPNVIELDYIHFLQPASFSIAEINDRETVVATVPATMYVYAQTVKYNLDFALEDNNNNFTTNLSGRSEDSIKVSDWEIEISKLTVDGKLEQEKYTLILSGIANLDGGDVQVNINHDHGGYNDAVYELNIQKIPLHHFLVGKIKDKLGSIIANNITIKQKQLSAYINYNNTVFVIHAIRDQLDNETILFENPTLAVGKTFYADSSQLEGLELASSMIIYQAEDQEQTIDLSRIGLNADLQRKLIIVSGNQKILKLSSGFTLFGVVAGNYTDPNNPLKNLGLNDDTVLIKGELNETAVHDLIAQVDSDRSDWTYNLEADLSSFSMLGLTGENTFLHPRLVLSKQDNITSAKIDTTLALVLNGEHFQLTGEVDLIQQVSEDKNAGGLLFKGNLVGSTWPAALGIHWLRLENVRGFYKEVSNSKQENIKPGLHLQAGINLQQHNMIPVNIQFDQKQDSFGNAMVAFGDENTMVDLSNFPHLAHITSVSKLMIKKLQLNISGRGDDRILDYSALVDNPDQVIQHPGLELSGQTLLKAVEKTGQHWDITIDGQATLNKKQVQYHAELDTIHPDIEDHFVISFSMLSGEQDHLPITDVLGIDNKALQAVYPESIQVKNGFVQSDILLGENAANVISFPIDDKKIVAIIPSNAFSLDAIVEENHWIKQGVSANQFIGFLSDHQVTIQYSDLPQEITSILGNETNEKIILQKNTLNIIGSIVVEDNSVASQTLQTIGIIDKEIALSGQMDTQVFLLAAGLPGAVTDTMLKTIELEGKITDPILSGFDKKNWLFENTVLKIGSSDRISGDFTLLIGDEVLHGNGGFSLNNIAQDGTINFSGKMLSGWEFPQQTPLIHFDDLSITAKIGKNNQEVNLSSTILLDGDKYPMLGVTKIDNKKISLVQFHFKDKNITMPLGRIKSFQTLNRSNQIMLDEVGIEIDFNDNNPSLKVSGNIKQANLTDFPGITVNEGDLSVVVYGHGKNTSNKWSGEILNGMMTIPGTSTPAAFKASIPSDSNQANNKSIPYFIINLEGNHKIADLLDSSIKFSGFEETPLSSVMITKDSASVSFDYDEDEVKARIFYPKNKVPVVSFNMTTFPVDKLISDSNTFDGVGINKALIVVTPDNLDDTVIKVSLKKGFSKSNVKKATSIAYEDKNLVGGANLFAILESKDSQLNKIFTSLGIPDNLDLVGDFDPNVLSDNQNESLVNVDLKAIIKVIDIPGMPSGSKLKNSYFRINGGEDQSESEIYIGIHSELDLNVNKETLSFVGDFNFSGNIEEQKIKFIGGLQNNWRPINWMQFGDIEIKAEFDHREDNIDAEIILTGNGYLKADKFDLEIDLNVVENKLQKISFDISGDGIAVSDIQPLAAIPRADKIQLSEIFFELDPQTNETHFKANMSSSELIDFAGVKIDGGVFYADKISDGWDIGIKNGKVIIHGNPLEYSAEVNKFEHEGKSIIDFIVSIEGELNLQQLIGPSIQISSELQEIALESIEITRHSADIAFKFKKTEFEANVYRPKNKKPHISLIVNDFSLDELIPNAEILSGVNIDKAALVILLDKSEETNSIDLDQVPEYVREEIENIDGDVTALKSGVNIFAALDIESGSLLENFFNTIGIKSKSGSHQLELEGSFDPGLMFGNEDKTSSKFKQILKTVEFYANIDELELVGLPAGSEFTNTNFHISGSGGVNIHGEEKEGFFVGIGSDLKFIIAGDSHEFKGSFDFLEKDHEIEIEFSGFAELDWHAPLGLSWITLNSLGISATLDKKKYNNRNKTDFNVDISAKTKLGEKEVDIDVVIEEENVRTTNQHGKADRKNHFQIYLDVKTNITAADIPVLKNIPNASGFGLTEVIFASDGVVAKTLLNNVEVDAAAIQVPVAGNSGSADEDSEEGNDDAQGSGKAWLFIVEQQDGSLFEFIPGLGDFPLLKQIHMKEVFFAVATKNIRINSIEDLPVFVRDIFEPMIDVQPSGFHLVEGIGVGAVFNPLEGNSDLANALGQVGISGESMIVGEIGGIFGGQPNLSLLADLPSLRPSTIKGMEFFSWIDGITPRFLVTLGVEGLEIQLDIDMVVTIKDDKLSFDGGVDFDLKDDEIGLEIFGDFRGANGGSDPGWHNPLGLNGLTIEQITLDCGFEDGALEFGLAGAMELNNHLYKVGTDFSIEFESVIPSIQGIGFNLQKDVVGPQELLDILALLSGEQLKIDADQLPFLQLHDALITFATPGMSNPNLGIVGPGAAVSGTLTFLGQELGNLKGSIYPTSGIKLKGKIDPLNFAVLELKENYIDFALVWDQLPHLNMKGNTRVLFAEQDISIDVVPPKYAKFDLKDSLGPFGEAEIKADMYGLDFSSGRLLDHADIYLYGGIHNSDFFGWLENTAKDKVNDIMNVVHKGIIDVEKKVSDAQKKVDSLNKNIEYERSIVRSERQRTVNWINAAEKNVHHLQDLINMAQYNVNHCPWYAFWCFAQWGGEIIGLNIVYGVAEGVLEGIRLGATLTPIDLDPRVSVLIVAHESATLVLKLAKLSLEGFDKLDRVAETIINKFIDDSYKLFGDTKINDISFKGSLLGYVKHREPWFFNIDMELGGQALQEKIMFKPSFEKNDVTFNLAQIVPVSLHVIEVVLDAIKNKIPIQFLGRILDEISNEIKTTEQNIKKIFEQHKFELDALQKEQTAVKVGSDKQVKIIHGEITMISDKLLENWRSQITSITDLKRDSQHFDKELIEVGHSGHCLKRSKNGLEVKHGECSGSDPNQKWNTVDLGSGYAAIQVFQRCLKPVVTGSNAKHVKLILDACDRGQEAQFWKVLSHDNDFFRFMNKTNGKCLHFQNPSAIPDQVEGEWWPCHGADSQVFRLIKNTKPVIHTAKTPLYAVNSNRCIQTQAQASTGSLASSQSKHLPAKAVSCGSSKHQVSKKMLFDYVENYRGYLKIYDQYSGQCIMGSSDHSAVSSPCNQSDFSFWRKDRSQGGFRLVNKATKQCLQLVENGTTQLASCNNHADQIFAYGFPEQKIVWEEAKAANLKNVISGAAKNKNKISIFNAGLLLHDGSYSNAEIVCQVDRGNRDQRIGRLINSGECLYAAYTEDYKMIKIKHSQLCFNIDKSDPKNSARLNQSYCTSLDNQLYSFNKIDGLNGYYNIHPKHSGKCLTVQDASTEDKTLVWQWDCLHQDNQKWLVRKSQIANGYYQLIAKHSEKCMNIEGSSKNRGVNITQSKCINQDNQRYAFIYPRASNFKILKQTGNSQWIKASGYTVPTEVLPMGHYQNSNPIYACRILYGNKIYAGWAKDYKCHAIVENKGEEKFVISTQFEYLSAN